MDHDLNDLDYEQLPNIEILDNHVWCERLTFEKLEDIQILSNLMKDSIDATTENSNTIMINIGIDPIESPTNSTMN